MLRIYAVALEKDTTRQPTVKASQMPLRASPVRTRREAVQLRKLLIRTSIPFIGFGFFDNMIMLTVGAARRRRMRAPRGPRGPALESSVRAQSFEARVAVQCVCGCEQNSRPSGGRDPGEDRVESCHKAAARAGFPQGAFSTGSLDGVACGTWAVGGAR